MYACMRNLYRHSLIKKKGIAMFTRDPENQTVSMGIDILLQCQSSSGLIVRNLTGIQKTQA